MNNREKGNTLIIAAVIGVLAAGAVFWAYKAFAPEENSGDFTLPTEDVKNSDNPNDNNTGTTENPADNGGKTEEQPATTTDSKLPDNVTDPGNPTTVNPTTPSSEAYTFTKYITTNDSAPAVTASNKFGFDLYAKYRQDTVKNLFFSPYSIFAALEMTYEGAKGATADEIRSVFHFAADGQTRVGSFAKLYSQINPQNATYQLSTANALWAQTKYPFWPDYLKTAETYYGGKATNLDFVNNTETSRQTINKWVSSKTNDKIPELFGKGTLDQSTRLVLTNAIYFKGKWETPFEKEMTQEKDFSTTQAKVKAQMMNRQSHFSYAETGDYQAIEIPYENNDLSMVVVLPKPGKMDTAEALLTTGGISGIKQTMTSQLVNLYIPKFKFDTSYNMNDTLSQMGMSTAFNPDKADFTGMYDRSKTNGENLYIGIVIHKAYVDVNEEGTEAAAATGVGVFATTAVMEPETPKEFNADHPFIFAIVHNQTGAILFLGKVNDPTK